jgi:hypothetical protein
MARRAIETNERYNMKKFFFWAIVIFLVIAIPSTLAALFAGFLDGLLILVHNVNIPHGG